jgi:hypothetical protein
MSEPKLPIKVAFAPGCFDDFEGTQEELDQLMQDITDKFQSLSPDEIKSISKPLDLDAMDEEELQMLAHALCSKEELEEMGVPNLERKLQ